VEAALKMSSSETSSQDEETKSFNKIHAVNRTYIIIIGDINGSFWSRVWNIFTASTLYYPPVVDPAIGVGAGSLPPTLPA